MGKADKAKGNRGGGGDGDIGARLVLVGAVAFVIAWFVPAIRGQDLLLGLPQLTGSMGISPEGLMRAMDAPDWLPGWSACRVSFELLIHDHDLPDDQRWKQYVLGASCLTNVAMVLTLLLTVGRRHGSGGGLLLLGCAGLAASWLYAVDWNPFEHYRAGYYLWLGSFVLVGLGLLLRRR